MCIYFVNAFQYLCVCVFCHLCRTGVTRTATHLQRDSKQAKVMALQHLAAPLVAALPALLLVQYTREEADKFSAEVLTFVFVVTAACLFFIAAREQGQLHDFDDADSADEVALKKAVAQSNSLARRLWRRVFTRADWKHNVCTCFENVFLDLHLPPPPTSPLASPPSLLPLPVPAILI
jgi:hypothetical protein